MHIEPPEERGFRLRYANNELRNVRTTLETRFWPGNLCLFCRPCGGLFPPVSARPAARPGTHLLPDRRGLERHGNLRSDVAIAYGIDAGLPQRIQTWRDRGYRIHVMTGVSWGQYQDYLYGRFDGVNHEDEAQTDRAGQQDQPRRRCLLHVPGDELREIPLRGRPARAGRGRRGDPPRGAGVLGARRLLGGLQARVAQLTIARTGSRRTARWTPSGARPSSSITSTGAPCSRCLITCRTTTAAPAGRCAATCPRTAC